MRKPIPYCRRALAAASGAILVQLGGCGGSPMPVDPEGFGQAVGSAVGNVFVCVLANCKSSADVAIQDLAMSYTVQQSGNQLSVQAQLQQASKSAPIQLTGSDRLMVELDGKSTELKEDGSNPTRYSASFISPSAQPTVKISFVRGAQGYASQASVPARFELLSPSAPVAMNRRSSDLDVVLQLPSTSSPVQSGSMRCSLTDGSSTDDPFTVSFEKLEAGASQQRYRSKTSDLAKAIDDRFVATSVKPQSCRLQFSWAVVQAGSAPAGLHAAGTRKAQYAVSLAVDFDAKP